MKEDELYIKGSNAMYNTLYIDAKRTIIKDREFDIEIDLSNIICNIDKICINGVYYIKKK